MNLKSINLVFRFLLEVISLIVFGSWGFSLAGSWIRFVWMTAVPLGAAAFWGIFAVPDDPSLEKRQFRFLVGSDWFWRVYFSALQL